MNLPYDIVWLRPKDIRVDPASQRPFDAGHANRIAKKYDPALFGLGHVSLRADGGYYAVDSQHRCAGATLAERDDEPVPFRVYKGLTLAQENQLFLDLNANKKSVSALDTFNKSCAAGNPINIDIVRILKLNGLRVAAHRAEGGVAAVVALLQIYQGRVGTKTTYEDAESAVPGMPGGELLNRTLAILVKAYKTEREAFDGVLMRGVAALILKHGTKLDTGALADALKRNPPVVVIGNIRGLANLGGSSPVAAAVSHLEHIYNFGRRENKKLVP